MTNYADEIKALLAKMDEEYKADIARIRAEYETKLAEFAPAAPRTKRLSRGDFLRMLRESHRLTQDELAQMIPCSPASVSRWENNKAYPWGSYAAGYVSLFGIDPLILVKKSILFTEDSTPPYLAKRFGWTDSTPKVSEQS